MQPPDPDAILQEGRNCWRIARASRVAFLVDSAAYFEAFARAALKAKHSIMLLGWDFERREPLLRDHRELGGLPVTLGDFLDGLVRRRRGLHVDVLVWDFAMIYAMERELFPVFNVAWKTHRRFRFRLDGEHPVGASQHQKVAVIDDRVAFVGGIDLGKWRWDTCAHAPGDPRRTDPDGKPYPPFHDVQFMVEGEVAAVLGDLARERWRRAGASPPRRPPRDGDSPWPERFEADLRDVAVAVARTEPRHDGRDEVREVERLHLDAVRIARRWLYVENQYFTSERVAAALAERLREPDGPEVVLVMPRRTGGWLEQNTMDVLRARVLRKLREADRHGRLRLYYPSVPGLRDGECISVHAKIVIADDRLLRNGSANISNRSMGFDTECDLAVEAGGDGRAAEAIAGLRHRLLGEHLGVEPAEVARAEGEHGSLIAAIEALNRGERGLVELPVALTEAQEKLVPDGKLLDPERPVAADEMVERYVPPETHSSGRRRAVGFLALVVFLLALAAAWRWTPLNQWLSPDAITEWIEGLQSTPVRVAAVLGGFVVGGFVMLPLTLLVMATAVALGPWEGFAYALAGAVLSAALSYGVGHSLGRETVRRLGGERLNRISRSLASKGVGAVAVIRLFPVAPFTVVNLAAGASHIGFWDFLLGTLIGMAPGILGVAVFASSLYGALTNPEPRHLVMLAGVIVVLVGGTLLLRRYLRSR